MTRRVNINQVQLTSHLALRPMWFWDYAGEWSKNVTTLDNEDNVVSFEIGKTAYFDGEEFARSGRLVQVDGPGEPTGMVTITSVDRGSGTIEFGSDEWMQRELDADYDVASEPAERTIVRRVESIPDDARPVRRFK